MSEHLVLPVVAAVALMAGVVLGAVVVFLVSRSRASTLGAEITQLNESLESAWQVTADWEKKAAVAEALLAESSKNTEGQSKLLEEMKSKMGFQFENLANSLFDRKAEQNRMGLQAVLQPMQERLLEFQKQVAQAYEIEGRERFSLAKEVKHLAELNQQVSKDTESLTKALKGESKTQGDWGEVILDTILEGCGLRKGVEYETQASYRDTDNRLLRPDTVLHLPDQRDIVIDSKVSLVSYEKYCNAETDDEQAAAAKDFIASIQAHIKGLESKSYDELPGINSLDFVLMFVPIEGAFMLALNLDQGLYRRGFERGVMMVSPSTLLFTLRTISNLWRTEYQSRNAIEIAENAAGLYDKFVAFVEDLEGIGAQLCRTQKAFDAAHNKLVSGRGNLVKRSQDLVALGVKAKKKLPASAVQETEAFDLIDGPVSVARATDHVKQTFST